MRCPPAPSCYISQGYGGFLRQQLISLPDTQALPSAARDSGPGSPSHQQGQRTNKCAPFPVQKVAFSHPFDWLEIFFFLSFHLFIFAERGRERNILAKREALIGCLSSMPRPGTRPATQACTLTGDRTGDPSLCGMTPKEPSPTSQGNKLELSRATTRGTVSLGERKGALPSTTGLAQAQALCFILFIFHLFIFRATGEEGEREGNTCVWLPLVRPLLGPATQACALTGNRTSHPLVRRPVLSPRSRPSWAVLLW